MYNGERPLLVGHQNYSNTDQPFIYQDRVFGLNTDCVTGKALTGLLLPSFKFLSVPSRANYWVQVRRMYLETETPSAPTSKAIEWSAKDEERLIQLLALSSKEPIQSYWSYILNRSLPAYLPGNRQNYSVPRWELVPTERYYTSLG